MYSDLSTIMVAKLSKRHKMSGVHGAFGQQFLGQQGALEGLAFHLAIEILSTTRTVIEQA